MRFPTWKEVESDPEFQSLEPAKKREYFGKWSKTAVDRAMQQGLYRDNEFASGFTGWYNQKAKEYGEEEEVGDFQQLSTRLRQPTEVGIFEGISNSARNAFASSQQALAVTGGVTSEEAQEISKIEYEKNARQVSPDYKAYQEAEGWDAVKAFVTNPVEVTTNIVAEGLAGSLPSLGAGLAAGAGGAAVGSVVPGVGTAAGFLGGQVAGTFAGSLATEYGSKVLEELQNEGMDLTNPQSITEFFSNQKLVNAAKDKALKRGVPVAAFDAVSAGIGGKVSKILGTAFKTKTREATAELAIQAGLGGGGEVVGSLVAGDEIDPKAVFAEVVGELGPGSAEIAIGKAQQILSERRKQRQVKQAAETAEKLENSDAPLTADALKTTVAKNIVEQEKQTADKLDEDLAGEVEKVSGMQPIREEEAFVMPPKEEFKASYAKLTPESLAETEASFQEQLQDEDADTRAFAQTALEALAEFRAEQTPAPTAATTPAPAETPLEQRPLYKETGAQMYQAEAIKQALANRQPVGADAIEFFARDPRTWGIAIPRDYIRQGNVYVPPPAVEAPAAVAPAPAVEVAPPVETAPPAVVEQTPVAPVEAETAASLSRVANNTATDEEVVRLARQGLVNIQDGQNVITPRGEEVMQRGGAPLPRLTPEERAAEVAAAPAIVEQEPVAPEVPAPTPQLETGTIQTQPFQVTIPDATGQRIARMETIEIPMEWDAEINDWLMTEEGSRMVDETKQKGIAEQKKTTPKTYAQLENEALDIQNQISTEAGVLALIGVSDDNLTISGLESREKGKGAKALEIITSAADKNQTTITLKAEPKGGDVQRLKKLYSRFGFVDDPNFAEGSNRMIRFPAAKPSPADPTPVTTPPVTEAVTPAPAAPTTEAAAQPSPTISQGSLTTGKTGALLEPPAMATDAGSRSAPAIQTQSIPRQDAKTRRYVQLLGNNAPQAIAEAKVALAKFKTTMLGKRGDNPFQAEPRLRELKNVISLFVANRLNVTNQNADKIAEQIILGKPNIVDKATELKPIKAKELDDVGANRSSIMRFGYELGDKKTYRHPREGEAIAAPAAPAEAAPVGIAVGDRVKLKGNNFNSYIVKEALPQADFEIRNNEQSFVLQDAKTGQTMPGTYTNNDFQAPRGTAREQKRAELGMADAAKVSGAQQASDAGNALDLIRSNYGELSDIINKIIDSNPKIADALKKIPVKKSDRNSFDGLEVKINRNYSGPDLVEAVNHEVVHAFLAVALREVPSFKQAIESIRNEAIQRAKLSKDVTFRAAAEFLRTVQGQAKTPILPIRKDELLSQYMVRNSSFLMRVWNTSLEGKSTPMSYQIYESAYALSSNDEFLAHMMTSPNFRNELKSYEIYEPDTRNLFEKFIDAIKSLFKKTVKVNKTILDKAMEQVEYVVQLPEYNPRPIEGLGDILAQAERQAEPTPAPEAVAEAAPAERVTRRTKMQNIIDISTGVKRPRTKLTVDEMAALKDQIRIGARKRREDKQTQKEFAKDVTEYLRGMAIRGKVSAPQLRAVTSKAMQTQFDNEASIKSFINYANKVIENANYNRDISDAKAAIKTANKKARQKEGSSRIKAKLKELASFNPNDIEPEDMSPRQIEVDGEIITETPVSVAEYTAVLKEYMASLGPVTAEGFRVIPEAEIIDFINKVRNQVASNADARNKAAFAERLQKALDNKAMLPSELDAITETQTAEQYEEHLKKKGEEREKIEKAITDLAMDTQSNLVTYDDSNLNADELQLVNFLRALNVSDMRIGDRKNFVMVANNIIVNNDFSGAQKFEYITRGQLGAAQAAKDSQKVKRGRAMVRGPYAVFDLVSGNLGTDIAIGMQSLADTVRNITSSDKLANLLYQMGYGEIETGRAKSMQEKEKIQNAVQVRLDEIQEKNKQQLNDPGAMTTTGIAATLIQTTNDETEAEGIQRMRNLVQKDIEKKKGSWKPEDRKEAIRAEKALKDLNADSVEGILAQLQKLYPANYETLMFFMNDLLPAYKESFKKHDEMFNNQTDNYDNPYYLPIKYRTITTEIKDPGDGVGNQMIGVSSPKQSKNSIKRVKNTVLPENMTFDYNLVRNVMDSLSGQLDAMYMNPGLQQLSSFLKSENAIEGLGGAENLEVMKRRANMLANARERHSYDMTPSSRLFDSIANFVRKIGSSVALGGFTQAFKQMPDQMITTFVNVGDRSITLPSLTETREARDAMMQFSIGMRGEIAGGAKWINQLDNDYASLEKYFKEGLLAKVGPNFDKINDAWLFSLKFSDSFAAAHGWISYYKQYLKKNGIAFTNWDNEAKLIANRDESRVKAGLYADNQVDTYQGSSDPTKMAQFAQRGRSGGENLLKTMILPFSSFVIQQRARILTDLRNIIYGNAEERAIGARGLTGTIFGIIAFHSMRRYLLPIGLGFLTSQLYGLLGIDMDEPDEEEEQKKKEKVFKQFISEVATNITLGGYSAFAEAQLIDKVNLAAYAYDKLNQTDNIYDEEGKELSWEKYRETNAPLYRYTGPGADSSLGMVGIIPEQLGSTLDKLKDIGDEELMDSLTDEEQNLLILAAFSETLYTLRLNDADVARLINRMTKEVKDQAKEREKEQRKLMRMFQ